MTIRKDTSWHTSQIIETFNNLWATDEWIASSYIDIAENATKSISTKDDWVIEVPDYWNRRESLKDIAKIKWLFNKVALKNNELPTDSIYVFE